MLLFIYLLQNSVRMKSKSIKIVIVMLLKYTFFYIHLKIPFYFSNFIQVYKQNEVKDKREREKWELNLTIKFYFSHTSNLCSRSNRKREEKKC